MSKMERVRPAIPILDKDGFNEECPQGQRARSGDCWCRSYILAEKGIACIESCNECLLTEEEKLASRDDGQNSCSED